MSVFAVFSVAACSALPNVTSSSDSFSESFNLSESLSNSSDKSASESSSVSASESFSSESASDSSSDDYDPLYYYAESVMNEAELLSTGESLSGIYTLSGVVTEIDLRYSSSVSLYFDVDEPQHREMYCYKLKGSGFDLISKGDHITVQGTIKNYKGIIEFDTGATLVAYTLADGTQGGDDLPDIEDDPYANVTSYAFYSNYTPATDADDAYYRSLHGFMSGELTVPDQAPTLSPYRPKNGNKYVRNSEMQLSEDGRTYTVVDAYGNEAFHVFQGGAYITLEEVAAYVYAFGTYPANYTTSKSTKPTNSIWGEYLRLNHTAFSGDTDNYPYEPVLPNISGCGGDLHYYEMDIGTTGTDCDPAYTAALYNNGSTITRGAARIVYGKEDLNGNGIYELGEFHVFYTYNHYNDFQEYLNYEGGWGEMFGNITGGGTISSKSDYNPTDYVEISLEALPTSTYQQTYTLYFNEKRKDLL